MTKTHRIEIEEAENGYTVKVYPETINSVYINVPDATFVFHKPQYVGTYISEMLQGVNDTDSERRMDEFFARHGEG